MALAVVALSPVVYAVDPARAMSQYVRDRWGPEQGFPSGAVYAITQTPDGYLWIGSEAGLIRFDGIAFRLITNDSIPISSVLGLIADDENNLWVRLQGPTLLRYRDGVFENAMTKLGMPYSNVTVVSKSSGDDLLVARLESGVIHYHAGKFATLADASPLARSPVISVAQTMNGDVWMGTRDAGLFRLEGRQVSAIASGLPDTKINVLLPDGDRSLWVGTDHGVVRWNGSELTAKGIPPSLNQFQTLALAKDRDANLWVGTDSQGLLRLNSQGVASFGPNNGGTVEAITAIFEDREGNLWVGSAGGIERIRDSAFVTYSMSEGLPTGGSIPVFIDSTSRLWFPPVQGGLWWLKDEQHGAVTAGSLKDDVIYSIAGEADELWLGRQRGGLTQLKLRDGVFAATTYTKANGLAQDSVYSVHQTRDGAVWVGTLSGGVSRLQNGGITTFTTSDGLASNTVASIVEAKDGSVWFATPSGLSAFSGGRWRSYAATEGGSPMNVNCLLEDTSGVLWAGTSTGLIYRSGEGFRVPAGLPASLREQVLGIAEDRYGWLWMATSNHVLRVRRASLLQGAFADGDIREYGLADGLRGMEGVKRHQSVTRDQNGRIWFSLNRGISMVDPSRLSASSLTAFPQLQTISADGAAMNLRNPIQIPAGSQRITLGFAGLSLSVPERVRYRYKLDGFDRTWSEPVTAREAVYTNLGPGTYKFHVIASNPDGVWGETEAATTFQIAPYFWQSTWFLFSIAVGVAAVIAGLYRFRLHQLTQQLNLRFDERLAERTRIAQELHDTLLQGFLSASMQLHVTTDGLPNESPARPALNRILQLMGRVIEEGRNAVRGLRSADSAVDLAQSFSRIREEFAVDETVEFRVIVEGQSRHVHPVLRDEIYRIGREALVNAFRHSKAKKIEVELDYTTKALQLLVRDNGCGIEPSVVTAGKDGHWGLPGMRERAERIGGKFNVWSSPSAGTEVMLSVPGNVAFQVPGRSLPKPAPLPLPRDSSETANKG
jgi:ligand-binding sensor domain-containing protein/signal transduction histidine kinase